MEELFQSMPKLKKMYLLIYYDDTKSFETADVQKNETRSV